MEVEVREEASVGGHRTADSTALLVNNTPIYPATDGPIVIVRVEEVLLVVLVLIIWMAAIALFFNRWGKIRMLEPYQPKFRNQASHRPSCPLAPLSPPGITPQVSNNNTLPRTQKPTTQRMSFSKYNVNAMTDPLSALPSPIIRRPRRNSVFVGGGSSTMAILHPPPRRVKSAIDIQHLIVNDHSPTSLSGSVIPILNRDRRPSITIERPHRHQHQYQHPHHHHHHHRPSITIDRVPPPRLRRSSCFVGERLLHHHRSHRNFISFDHPTERPSCSYQHHHHLPLQSTTTILPTVSFEAHHVPSSSSSSSSSSERITAVTVEIPPSPPASSSTSTSSSSSSTGTTITTTIRQQCFPKMSKSFEQPPKEKLRTERMANSLDVTSISFDRRCLIQEEEDRASPVFICLDETKVTAPLLESLKSSDV